MSPRALRSALLAAAGAAVASAPVARTAEGDGAPPPPPLPTAVAGEDPGPGDPADDGARRCDGLFPDPGGWPDGADGEHGHDHRGDDDDPDPLEGAAGGEGDADTALPRWVATRILDAATGLPVAGARLGRYPERVWGGFERPWYLLDLAHADGDGFAWMETRADHWSDDCHWVASAPGHAHATGYGVLPEGEMLLARGTTLRGRVLDPTGKPAAGALVELFPGCGHSPTVVRAEAGPDGRFVLEPVDPGAGTFWITHPSGRARSRQCAELSSMGGRERDIVLEPAWTARGRVVDAAGDPVPGVVVRAPLENRGPATATDGEGRFALHGVRPGEGLQFFHPASEGAGVYLDDHAWADGVPFTVRLSSRGWVEGPGPDGLLVVRALDGPAGPPVEDVGVRIVGADGLVRSVGVGEHEVNAGVYRVEPDGPFDAFAFDPVTVTLGPADPAAPGGGATTVTLVLRGRPTLQLEGPTPEGAEVALVVGGDEVGVAAERFGDPPHLPAEGPAWLRVALPDDGPVVVLPVGPVDGGKRRVVLDPPRPSRIRTPDWVREIALLDGERPVGVAGSRGRWTTWGTGRLRLVATAWGGPLAFPGPDERRAGTVIEIPSAGGADVDVDLPEERALPRLPAVVRLDAPPDAPGDIRVEALSGECDREPDDGPLVRAEEGALLRIRREGWIPLLVRAVAGETTTARWGDAAVAVEVRDLDGRRVDAVVAVDGHVVAAPGGSVVVRGLAAGRVRVRAAFRDSPRGGRVRELDVGAGETATCRLVLGVR